MEGYDHGRHETKDKVDRHCRGNRVRVPGAYANGVRRQRRSKLVSLLGRYFFKGKA